MAIAPSTIPFAGNGLFLLAGPAEDGSAPPGTRVTTYDGIIFRTSQEQQQVRSDEYRSDYVWEGLNPFTNEIIMVDGAPKNSYGPFKNDGLGFKEANTELVFGSDGKLYVANITTSLDGIGNRAASVRYSSSDGQSKGVELDSESGEEIIEVPKKVVSTVISDRMVRSFKGDLNSKLTTNI